MADDQTQGPGRVTTISEILKKWEDSNKILDSVNIAVFVEICIYSK